MGPAVYQLTEQEQKDYQKGWQLFAQGEYWHAHEAWEALWRRSADPVRLFVQGLIQLAAARHLAREPQRTTGALKNLAKARDKLCQFSPRFLQVDVAALLGSMEELRVDLERQLARGSSP